MTKLTRRSVMAGSAAVAAAVPTLATSVIASVGEDAELRSLWAEFTETWSELQEATTQQYNLRCAVYRETKRLWSVYYLKHISPMSERSRRKWKSVERLHPFSDGRYRKQWRHRPIPGSLVFEEAEAFAKERLASEMEAHRKRVSEIRSWHGLDSAEERLESLRARIDYLREAIKRIPATTLFGVGVRLTAQKMGAWGEDYWETFNSTLATVGQLCARISCCRAFVCRNGQRAMLQEIALRADQPLALRDASIAAGEYAQASKAVSTRRAYQSDAADFALWCKRQGVEALPASVETVVAYLAALAQFRLKASTITRRRAAIAYMHRLAGLESPTASEAAKAVLAGIRRSLGTAVERKAPITAKAIRTLLGEMTDDLRGRRDRALLLIGFAGALRRSELVALDVEDIEDGADGIFLRIRRSKTDQERQGDFVAIPNGYKLRPVDALTAWLQAAGITEGSIFRSIKKGGQLTTERLTDRSVADILKKRSAAAGLDTKALSGHSLRSGFVTEALANGADVFRVMDVTRHRQVNTLKIYDRRANAFQDHAGAAFL